MFEWRFALTGLLPEQVQLKKKVWLKKDEILLQSKNDKLFAYIPGTEQGFGDESKIVPYLWISSLLTYRSAEIAQAGGTTIESLRELGTGPRLSASVRRVYSKEAIAELEKHAPKFIASVSKLYEKYERQVSDNEFISIALDYFWESEKKGIFKKEGFIDATVSLEALFNENPSDISYKLSHRAAFLLGLGGLDSIKVFEKIRTFYSHRSKIVHGAGSSKKQIEEAHLLSEYTRKSIIIFLILLKEERFEKVGKKKRKQTILKEIDYAMLDPQHKKRISNEVKRGLRHFKLPFPRLIEVETEDGKQTTSTW